MNGGNRFATKFLNLLKDNLNKNNYKVKTVKIKFVDYTKLSNDEITKVGYISNFNEEHVNIYRAITSKLEETKFVVSKIVIESNQYIPDAIDK
jgi:DNA topoisomerase VI subunit A